MQSMKILMIFFTELKQIVLTFVENYIRPQLAKTRIRKKNTPRGIMLPDFKLYYKSTIIQYHGTGPQIDMKISGM